MSGIPLFAEISSPADFESMEWEREFAVALEEGDRIMNLTYAVDRLVEAGWCSQNELDLEHLPDGRAFPSVIAVEREFTRAGLELSIKHNLIFNCYRATWAPIGEPLDPGHDADERHGTVVGACEREAAVYALAQLKALEHHLVGA